MAPASLLANTSNHLTMVFSWVYLSFGILYNVICAVAWDSFVCTGDQPPAHQFNATTSYLGCWTDAVDRTLGGRMTTLNNNDPVNCADYCGNLGFGYSAVEYTTQCFCGQTINRISSKTNESACTDICPGNSSAVCGGSYLMNLYKITNPNPHPPPVNPRRTPACETNPLCAQKICNKKLSIQDRVASLIHEMTLDEKISNMVNTASGVPRLGLPEYEWWSEALHGIAGSPGVTFQSPNGSEFSYSTSFPTPILMGAAFDDQLIHNVASVIGKEARAFANYGNAGFDFWTPNINPFLPPQWGRGLEVPSEDAFHCQSYVNQLVPGLQGGRTAGHSKQIIATCKHFAVYDVETDRVGHNYDPTQQDLAEYYLQPFKTCVRDAGVGSIMCSYNAVFGVPACANEYLLQDVLRDDYGFDNAAYRYVTSDCDAVANIYSPHDYTSTLQNASAVALNAGTDLDCGSTYLTLNQSVAQNLTTEANIDRALTRLYSALFTVGFFDGQSQYDGLGWTDVDTTAARALAYQAAWEGITLLKNDGTLPLKQSVKQVALIGPWANATSQMQGNYYGTAPFLISPLQAAQAHFQTASYALGTNISSNNTSGFSAALAAAKESEAIIYLGGIDTTIEAEAMDRTSLTWPGNQLDLIDHLSQLGKPLIVVQFGGGQVDDADLLHNSNVNSLVWAGYPGQDGGSAVIDILTGKQAPAGRLTTTQYPAAYINEVSLFDPNLRPSETSPGRTYKWYTGKPIIPFGHGLHYTTFGFRWTQTPSSSFSIAEITRGVTSGHANDATTFTNIRVNVKNTGRTSSDYVALLYLNSTNAGPTPRPKKALVAYARAHNIQPRKSAELDLPITLGSVARANEEGDLVVYPGDYNLILDNNASLTFEFSLHGDPVVVDTLARRKQ